MNLYIHDEKHEQIVGELNLGEITEKEKEIIRKICDFLEEKAITNRYKSLVLAESYEVKNDDGEPLIVFDFDE